MEIIFKIILVSVLIAPASLFAQHTGHRPNDIKEVIPKALFIITAKILINKVEKKPILNQKKEWLGLEIKQKIKIDITSFIKGKHILKEISFNYTKSMWKGKILTSDGSGMERQMKKGDEVILFFKALGKEVILLRAEKIENKNRIIQLLK